jgi:23S rRNA (adenine-N6)-dimethyltransferase
MASASGAGTGRRVFDLGAGSGAITAGLAATGARVFAVERDPKLAARLRRRFECAPNVRVVEADLRTISLPRRDFLVVANPPFSVTTAMCRRLLGDPAVPLAGAELIVQWGAARWLTAQRPRNAEAAWWSARYEIRTAQLINSASFAPPPRVNAAWLSVRPRPVPISARGQRCLRAILEAAYRRPAARTDIALAGRRRHRLAVLLDGGAADW